MTQLIAKKGVVEASAATKVSAEQARAAMRAARSADPRVTAQIFAGAYCCRALLFHFDDREAFTRQSRANAHRSERVFPRYRASIKSELAAMICTRRRWSWPRACSAASAMRSGAGRVHVPASAEAIGLEAGRRPCSDHSGRAPCAGSPTHEAPRRAMQISISPSPVAGGSEGRRASMSRTHGVLRDQQDRCALTLTSL